MNPGHKVSFLACFWLTAQIPSTSLWSWDVLPLVASLYTYWHWTACIWAHFHPIWRKPFFKRFTVCISFNYPEELGANLATSLFTSNSRSFMNKWKRPLTRRKSHFIQTETSPDPTVFLFIKGTTFETPFLLQTAGVKMFWDWPLPGNIWFDRHFLKIWNGVHCLIRRQYLLVNHVIWLVHTRENSQWREFVHLWHLLFLYVLIRQ